MAKKKATTKRSTSARTNRRKRSTTTRRSSNGVSAAFGRFGVPIVVLVFLVGVLGLLTAVYYRSIAESDFFKVRSVDVRGVQRTSSDDVSRTVLGSTEKTGLIDADISEIRTKVEKFPFVKTASISRQFPSGIRVDIVERLPVAIVRLKSGDHLVDDEGTILDPARSTEPDLPFAIVGWDEAKSEDAFKGNKDRLRLYKKMLDEWSQFGLTTRVKKVDLTRLTEPSAFIEDSGREIAVVLAKDRLGKSLRSAIEVVDGKGSNVRSINVVDLTPIINFIEK